MQPGGVAPDYPAPFVFCEPNFPAGVLGLGGVFQAGSLTPATGLPRRRRDSLRECDKIRFMRTGVLAAAGVTALLLGGGVAIATSISTNDDTIMACVKDRDGAMRYVTSDQCKRGESLISWKDGSGRSEWVLVDAEDTIIEDAFIESAAQAWVNIGDSGEGPWLPVGRDGYQTSVSMSHGPNGTLEYWYEDTDCNGVPYVAANTLNSGLLNVSPLVFGVGPDSEAYTVGAEPSSEAAEVRAIAMSSGKPGGEMKSFLRWLSEVQDIDGDTPGGVTQECISGAQIDEYGTHERVYQFESLGPPPNDLFVSPLQIVRR
jgi:hypothetical protein